jgi:hypothetical protein
MCRSDRREKIFLDDLDDQSDCGSVHFTGRRKIRQMGKGEKLQ